MVGKPNQIISKAHLQPIPAFDEPFNRIIIDCVSPCPKPSQAMSIFSLKCVLQHVSQKPFHLGILKLRTLLGLW